MSDPSEPDVVRNNERSRYELLIDGEVRGLADVHVLPDGRIGFPHTEVDHRLRNRGYGSLLVARALDDVRARGERAVAQCRFVRDFEREHPEYADVFAP